MGNINQNNNSKYNNNSNGGGSYNQNKSYDRYNNQNRNNGKSSSYGNNKDHNGNYGGKSEKKSNSEEKYVGAPYNFVPINNSVISVRTDELKSHAEIRNDLFTGEINYEIEAVTPIFIGMGKEKQDEKNPDDFYCNAYGKYAIPGSSLRGLIRSNVQILGMADISCDIDDYFLMYRSVATNDPNKKRYHAILGDGNINIENGSVSYLPNVKAGYIVKEDGKYNIYPAVEHPEAPKNKGEMNYFIISEKRIIESNDEKNFSYLLKKNKNWMQCLPGIPFIEDTDNKGKTHYYQKKKIIKDGKEECENDYNKQYLPYSIEISFKASNGWVTAIGEIGEFANKGYLHGSGYMQGKKVLYVIPQIDENSEKAITIPERDVKAFKVDYEKKKNVLKDDEKAFYDLPEEGEKKTVFYIEYGGRLYFGYTPHLRLLYDHSIKEGLKQEKPDGVDLAKSMFGFADDKLGAYKSKVYFSDAEVCDSTKALDKEGELLAEPKPSSYNDYLCADKGRAVSYGNDDFTLRGIKQYWLKNEIAHNKGNGNVKMLSWFIPLPSGTKFAGKLRFKNLTKEEFGLLLYSLKLEDASQMNIGKGKALGYGRIKLSIKSVKSFEPSLAYGTSFNLNPFKEISEKDIVALISDYQSYAKSKLNMQKEFRENRSIKTFFAMKNGELILDNEKTRYMSIDKREYQGRMTPLPEALDLLKLKKKVLIVGTLDSKSNAQVKNIVGKNVTIDTIDRLDVLNADKYSDYDYAFVAARTDNESKKQAKEKCKTVYLESKDRKLEKVK